MRLHKEGIDEIEAEILKSFDKWLLQIGDGPLYDLPEQELIRIPQELCKLSSNDPMQDIVNEVYRLLLESYEDPTYLKERAILTPKNETVHELNDFLMNMIPREERTYLSYDSVFTHGQVYVALSRVSTSDGLVIVNADSEVKDQHTLFTKRSSITFRPQHATETLLIIYNSDIEYSDEHIGGPEVDDTT
ncbi:uncharacterized protein LOC141660738 [Apium graveolens]|uniref:uncharacterized protein LOC141660738 n=1 Tax=Apium graveolens TaxID=4045 RepID=UPI003D78DF33